MKYLLVKRKLDLYDTGVVCIFDNELDRYRNEFHCQCIYSRKQSVDCCAVETKIIYAKEAYKKLNDYYMPVWDFTCKGSGKTNRDEYTVMIKQ